MKKYALLIGVEEYRDKMVSRLKFARADATAFADRLSVRCGFDYVRTLADESSDNEPLLVNIVTALCDTAAELRQEDLFLFYFAGHGIEKDGHGYLLARDSLQAFPEHGSLSLELLRKTFETLSASQRIIILDACRNSPDAGRGDTDNQMGDAISRDIVAAAQSQPTGGTTTVLLSACQAGQRAYEWPLKGHGVFTHFLLEGLSGAAWQQSKLEFRRLAMYVADQVQDWSSKIPGINQPQEPWYEEFGRPAVIILGEQVEGSIQVKPRPSRKKSTQSKTRAEVLCARCGIPLEEEWVACPNCGTIINDAKGEKASAAADASIDEEILNFRKSVYSRRIESLSHVALEAKLVFAGLSAVLTPSAIFAWLDKVRDQMIPLSRWFEVLYWDSLDRTLFCRANYPPRLLCELPAFPFGQGEGKATIKQGPEKLASKIYEDKSRFFLRAACIYAGIFKSNKDMHEALKRAEDHANSAYDQADVAIFRYRLTGESDYALRLTERATAKAKTTLDYAQLACAGTELGLSGEKVSGFLDRAEQSAEDHSDWESCASGWFDLLAEVDRAKSCARTALDMQEDSCLNSYQSLVERFVFCRETAFARELLSKQLSYACDNVTAGWELALLSLLWADIIGDHDQAVSILRQGEEIVHRKEKPLQKKWKTPYKDVFSWVRIARAWYALGDSVRGESALNEAKKGEPNPHREKAVSDAVRAIARMRRSST